MRVCLILEGCYPYIRGGVSSWAHEYIKANPDIDFVLWAIYATHKNTETVAYELPDNVVENHEIYLSNIITPKKTRIGHYKNEFSSYMEGLKIILQEGNQNWDNFLKTCTNIKVNITKLVSSKEFLSYAHDIADKSSGSIGLTDAFYGLRSMFIPLIYLFQQNIPQADIYHSAVAGYGGLLGAIAKYTTGKPFILTEHGIYPREREEELMQADWVTPSIRSLWILFFYNLSRCAYAYANKVTALFPSASEKQQEIGCSSDKCAVVANGIHVEKFIDIPLKPSNEYIDIGAFVRFAAIKDVKTLIYSFFNLQTRVQNVRLYIMGGTDDPAYKTECEDLIKRLKIQNIFILGHINTVEYMERMDFTVMTSISEGQPLAILESMAAGRPCVSTNVGNCAGLLQVPNDNCGQAGFCCTPMDIDGLSNAMEKLCLDKEIRLKFGENGRKRVIAGYTHDIMNEHYLSIYREVM